MNSGTKVSTFCNNIIEMIAWILRVSKFVYYVI